MATSQPKTPTLQQALDASAYDLICKKLEELDLEKYKLPKGMMSLFQVGLVNVRKYVKEMEFHQKYLFQDIAAAGVYKITVGVYKVPFLEDLGHEERTPNALKAEEKLMKLFEEVFSAKAAWTSEADGWIDNNRQLILTVEFTSEELASMLDRAANNMRLGNLERVI